MIPHEPTIEKSMLSLALQYPEEYLPRLLGDGVTDEHFFDANMKKLWKTLVNERAEKRKIELISLTIKLRDEGNLEDMGGAGFISECYSFTTSSSYYTPHLEILNTTLAKRRLYHFLNSIDDEQLLNKTPDELAQMTRQAAEAVIEVCNSKNDTKDASQACKEFLEEFTEVFESKGEPGIQTDLYPIDNLTGGMKKGEVWITSGATSSGKSALALDFAEAALSEQKQVGIFSLEMGARENIGRLISNKQNVDYTQIVKPKNISKGELINIKKGIEYFSKSNLRICDEAGLTVERIWAVAQKWHDETPLDMLVVDYIQLIQSTDKREARHEQLGCISGQFKQLAKKLKIPVIVPSQLNTEGRMAKAKSIADDADVVLRIEDDDGGIYVIKNRNGEKHVTLPLILNGKFQRFEIKEQKQGKTNQWAS